MKNKSDTFPNHKCCGTKYYMTEYKNYFIQYDPPPIPIRTCDWQFFAKDFDGGPWEVGGPPMDPRSGETSSLEKAKERIDELIEEYPELYD